MRKRLLIAFSIFFGIVLVILFIPSVFKTQVAQILKHELNSNVDADVSFSEADINLWRHFPQFTVSLENFVVAGKNEFLGDTLIRAKELNLVLSSAKLLFNDGMEIRHLALEEPEIFVAILSNGKTNYEISKDAPQDSTDDVVLNIESWEVTKGKFRYDDEETGIKLTTQNASLVGKVAIKGSVTDFTMTVMTTGFSALYGKKNYIRDKDVAFNLEGSYDSKSSTIKFSDNAISVNNFHLTFSGSVGFPDDDNIDVDLKFKSGEAEFKDILSLSKTLFRDFKKLNIDGLMSADAEFLGTFNSNKNLFPAFKMNLVVSDGSIKYRALPSSLNQINLNLAAYNTDGNLQNTIVDLQYFGMNIGENPIFGSAQIAGFNNGKLSADVLAKFPLSVIASVYPMEGLDMNGNLAFELKANGPFTGRLAEMALREKWNESKIPTFIMDLQLSQGNIKYSHLPEAMKDVNFHLVAENKTGRINETELTISQLEALLGDNPVKAEFNIKGIREPDLNGVIQASINLAEVKNFYPIEGLTLKGILDMDMKVNGKLSQAERLFPKVFANIKLNDGFIQSDEYPAPMENTHLVLQAINETGKFADTKFIIDTLTYAIEKESFFVSGSVQDLEQYVYDLDVKGILYLDKLQKILSLQDITMRGEVDIDLKTAGNLNDLKAKNYHRLPTEGHMRLRDVFVKNDLFSHGLLVKEGHLYFSNEKIFLDTLHGMVGESNFNLTGHLYNALAYLLHTDEQVKGDLLFESDNFTLNELLSEKKNFKDTVHHDLALPEIPGNIDFTFDSKINHLAYKNISVADLDGEIVVRNGVLTVNKSSFISMGAAFIVSGDYDPRDKKHPKFDVDLTIDELDINKAHEAFVTVQAIAPAAEHTYGIFSINYKLKGELMPNMFPVFESLAGGGTVWISDAKINGMKLFHHMSGITKKEELMNPKLKDIVMETTVDKGVIYVKPFSMKLAGFDTEIEGRHELSGSMNYLLKIALPPFDLVKIPMHIDGTYDNPKVHVGKGREEDLKKTIDVKTESDTREE